MSIPTTLAPAIPDDDAPRETATAEVVTVDELPAQYRCMPIFREFKPETLRAMAAQTWIDQRVNGSVYDESRNAWTPRTFTNARTVVEVAAPQYGLAAIAMKTCPIMFCLLYEQRAWLTAPQGMEDRDLYQTVEGNWVERITEYDEAAETWTERDVAIVPTRDTMTIVFDGEANGDAMASQILGRSPSPLPDDADLSPDDQERWNDLETAANDFIRAWDHGHIRPEHLLLVACPPEDATTTTLPLMPDLDEVL